MHLSILVPLYNAAGLIGPTLRSIGALPQDVEVLVVDDGSTDGSAREAADALAGLSSGRLVAQANAGPGAARNRAAAEARGRWLAFLDSDDLWFPWTLPRLREHLAATDAALIFLQNRDFRPGETLDDCADAKVATTSHDGFLRAVRTVTGLRFATCNAALRADAFAAAGGFNTALRYSEDTDLFLRIAGSAECLTAPPMIAHRIATGQSLTANLDAVEAGLDHMRAQSGAGVYHGSADDRTWMLGQSLANAVTLAFRSGEVARAYRLLGRHYPLLARSGHWRHAWQLPLRPVLNRLRPTSFPIGRRA